MADLLKCPKCGAVMVNEGYHEYAWYLDGKRVEGCPTEPRSKKAKRQQVSSSPAPQAAARKV